jgi:transcription elongation factor GreA
MSNPQEFFFTQEGIDNLKLELEELKGPSRNDLAKRLRVAIQQGDLSENADYSKAKEDQAFLEGRIQEIEIMLNRAVLIEGKAGSSKIIIGSTMTVQEDDRDPVTYFMVGPQEADPRNGRISHESPIGQSLMGHEEGETVEVQTPGGSFRYKILKVV